jgi:hypothetical protein
VGCLRGNRGASACRGRRAFITPGRADWQAHAAANAFSKKSRFPDTVSKARRAAARRGRRLRIMFADEARFGCMNRVRPCWAPMRTRPTVAAQLIREYIYLYGAVGVHRSQRLRPGDQAVRLRRRWCRRSAPRLQGFPALGKAAAHIDECMAPPPTRTRAEGTAAAAQRDLAAGHPRPRSRPVPVIAVARGP